MCIDLLAVRSAHRLLVHADGLRPADDALVAVQLVAELAALFRLGREYRTLRGVLHAADVADAVEGDVAHGNKVLRACLSLEHHTLVVTADDVGAVGCLADEGTRLTATNDVAAVDAIDDVGSSVVIVCTAYQAAYLRPRCLYVCFVDAVLEGRVLRSRRVHDGTHERAHVVATYDAARAVDDEVPDVSALAACSTEEAHVVGRGILRHADDAVPLAVEDATIFVRALFADGAMHHAREVDVGSQTRIGVVAGLLLHTVAEPFHIAGIGQLIHAVGVLRGRLVPVRAVLDGADAVHVVVFAIMCPCLTRQT